MEQGASDAGGDGDQVGLSGEDFYLAGAGEVGEVDRAAAADAGGGGLIGSDGRKLRQELAGMDEEVGCPLTAGKSRFLTPSRTKRDSERHIFIFSAPCLTPRSRPFEARVKDRGYRATNW